MSAVNSHTNRMCMGGGGGDLCVQEAHDSSSPQGWSYIICERSSIPASWRKDKRRRSKSSKLWKEERENHNKERVGKKS